MGNRISTEDLYKITQSLADRAVSDVKKRREDERKREEAIKKNREERLAAAAKQNRIPNYKGGSLWDQYKAALASGEAKNASDFITKRDARNAAWNKVGAETLNDDMEALAKSISSTYGTQFDPSKYYSQETINGSSDQVKKMRDRLNALAEYYNTYGGSDDQKKAVGEQIKAYDSELKFLNDLGAHYGQYKNEADFNYRTDKRRDEEYIVNDYDAEAGKKNLAELKGYLDRINTSSDSLSTGQLISNARSGKKAYNRTAINEAKQQYGLDGMTDDEVLNWLTQEYQLESFALNNVDRMRTAAGYRNLANNEDFLQGVISGKAVENPTFEDYLNYENEMFRLAEKVNSGVATKEEQQQYAELSENAPTVNNRFRFLEDVQSGKYGGQGYEQNSTYSGLDKALLNSKQYHYEQMTDDEKRVYYYLLGTQGAEAADRYLDDLKTTLDYRNTEEVKQYIRDLKNSKIFGNVSAAALANTFGGLGGAALGYLIADSNEGVNKTAGDIAYSAASVPLNVLGGAISTVGEIGQRLDLASKGDWEGKGYNPYANYNLFSVAGREARGLVAKDIEDKIGWEMFGQNVMSQVYQSLMSGVDSAFGMATLGKLYTISMGGSAAASKAAELYESGASSSQIYWESLFSGIAEATFEYLSIENLSSIKSIVESKPTTLKKAIKMILTQNGIEASEEIFTEISNTVIDKISKGYDSDYDRKVTEYVRDGMTREEAVKKAAGEVAADIGWAGAGGFISGLASSSLTIAGAYRAGKANADAQISAIDPGNAEGLYNNAKNIDYSILNDASEALKKGDAKAAAEIISEGKDWYEYLKSYAKEKYGKNQASEISANIDASIDNLNQIKNLISSGNINADSIQAVLEKAKSAQDTKVDVTSANDEKLFSLLAKGEPSNSVIEKNILKDRGTLAAFERLTGLRIGGTTVSQKRAAVREAFKAVSSSTETLKAAQNAIESGATATEGHKNAAVIIDQAIQANRAENSRLRNSEKVKSAETKAAIDATNRQHRFLETVRNYVINGGDLSGFTESPAANVSGEGGTNSSEAKTTQETAKKRVRADFSAYQDEITATEYNKAVKGSAAEQYTYFSNEEKKLNSDIKNIAESEAMTAEEKAEAIEKKNEEKNRLYALAKSTENVREMMRVKYAGNVDRLVEELQPKLKKYGIKIDVVDNIDTAGKSSSGAYFDRNTNTIKVSRNWDNFNNVVKLVLTGDGLAVTDRASVSFDRAVTQTIAHEIAHADSGLTLDFIKAVAGTQYDAFDLKGRLEHPDDRSWRSEDAQKEENWRRYVDAYTEQAMLEMKGTEEQRRASAEKVVNDAYIFEEIMADMFGAAVDDMGHSGKAGENIFWAMNRNKPGIIKRILNALERFIARIRGKDAYLAVEQRQAAERLRDMLTGELRRAYGTDVKGEAAVESGEGKRHSLAGANSRTADLNSLGGAYQMYQNGVSMDTIRKRTGWWLGKDGKWRYEISDKEMRFNPEGYVDNPQTVGDYVKHDGLFAAYPWIADIPVNVSDVVGGDPSSLGRYVPSENFIELKTGVPTEKTKHVLIHELQHAIQNKEHFTSGTNSTVTSRYIVNLAYNNVKNNPEFKAEKSPRGKMDYIIGYLEARMDANFDDIAKYYYSRNHGEIEAQYADKRLDMSDNARKAEPIVNYGDVYTREDVRADFIDNLKEMGYNEEQVNEILEEGIPYDNKHQNEQESLGQTGEGRKNLAGEAGRLPRQGTQRGERREVYRTGKVQVADSVKKTGQVDSLSDSTIFRRGRTDSETGRNGIREAQKRLNEVSKPEKRFSLSSNVEQIIENDSGEFVAESNGNGGTRWSLSTYESSGRETLRKYLDGQVSESGLTEADAKAVLDSMDEIYEICRKYEGEYAPFGAWSRAEVVIDEKGNPVFSVVKPNGEYAMNLDFSLVCKKRRALDAVLNRLIETGAINDFGFGQEEIVRVNEIIREHGFEIACDMCFVDAKRYRQAGVADQFVDLYNSIVKSMAKDGQEIDYFNFANDSSLSHTEGGIDRLSDAELDFSEINEITKPGAKKTVEYRIAQYLKTHPSDRKLLSRGDFMSTAGFDAVKISKPGILKLYNSKKGTGGPKAAQSDVQYLNDILSSKKFNRSAAYDVGGVRVQSFSDYVPRLVFDYVQMIGDLAAKRLPAHAYTKEPLFAKQFGLTGMKINMSLMPAKGNGKYAGLNADGSYAWAKESFPAEEAFRIQADPEYGKNVGTIAVGISDEHIWKMLSDPDIRMVIPYHKSGINPAVAVKLKIGEYTDYTGQQNTRRRDGKQLTKAELKNIPDINRLMHRDGLDAVEASRRYVEWCEDNGYIPKFEKFAYTTDSDGNRVFNENYYKLLEDFTTMVDGEFHPQGDVTATFPGSDSAFGSMADLIKEGLEEDAVTANRLNDEVDGMAEEIRSALVREESGNRFSLTRANDEYMKAVESGNVEEQQRLVDEAAENAGYDSPKVFHQTGERFWEFKTDNPVAGAYDSETPNGIFFKSNDHDIGVGGNYVETGRGGEIQMAAYLRMENTLHFSDRKEANAWYVKNVPGYEAAQTEMKKAVEPFDRQIDALDDEFFVNDSISEEEYDRQWNNLIEKLRETENKYRKRLREILDDYFLTGNSGYDSIELDYDGHRYIDGKRENVHTYIVFDGSQVKSADPITYDDSGNVIPLTERFDSGNRDIRWSLVGKYDYSKSFADQINDYKNGLLPVYDTFVVSETPKVWQDIGFNALPVTLNQTHVDYALNGTKDADHEISEADLKKLPEKIKEPIAIIQSQSNPSRAVVFIEMTSKNGKNVVTPVEVDGYGKTNNLRIDSNALASVFGKKNAANQLQTAIDNTVNGKTELFYWDKKRSLALLQGAGLQLPSGLPQDGFVHSIREPGSLVKAKMDDVTNSLQFKRWFGDWKGGKRNVSKVVNRDGSPRVVYHYTDADFEAFDTSKSGSNQGVTHGDGIYVSTNPTEFAYAGKNRLDLYASIKKPFEMQLTKSQAERVYDKYFAPYHDDKYKTYRPHVIEKLQSRSRVFDYLSEAADNGGVRTSDILKELGYDGVHDGSEWVAFDSTQLKSATDNIGTFDKDNPKLKYSLAKSTQSELKALQKENEKLRQDVDDLKQELQLTHGRKLSRDALISSIQKILIDGYGVKLSAKELYPHVTNLYDMFYNNTVDGKRLKKDERVDTMRIIEEMDKIVDAVIENAVGVDDTYVEMKKLLPELRNTKLVVPVDARADAAQSAGFENWAEFRKANFGRVGFANEGLPVDTYYMELSERYPELFPDGITHPGEQAAHIADVVNTIRESGINEYQLYDIEDERIRTSIKNDVMDIIGNAEKLQTFADRAAQKVEDTKLAEAMHYGADIAKLKRLNAEKVADIKAENRKRLSDMRRKYQDRVESVRERYAEARANRSEKQKQTVLRNKVLRKYTEASSMLDRPTTENHFTEAMREPIMEFLAAVDITTGKSVAKQGIYDRILRVIEAANNMAAEDGKNGLDIAETDLNVQEKRLIVDSGLLERMSAWVEANQGKKLTELSSAQLEELNGIFNQLKHLTAEIKRLYDPREGLAAKSWQAQKEIGLAKNRDRKTRVFTGFNTIRKGLEWVHYGSIDAYGFFNGIDSDVMDEQLRTFRKCQDKFGANIELLSSLMSDAIGKEGIPEGWHGKKAKEITLNLSTGTLRATPSQLMTVYLLLNQEDSRRCLFNKDGGLVIGKFKAKAAVQTKENRTRNWRLFRTMSVFNEQSGKLVLNEADANKIIESLTDAQIECADRISAILNGEAARLGNEVSMAMYGYKKYTTENYFPMRTVDDYRAIENNPNNEMTLLGLSFTHERTRLAGKALVAEDIFDVVGRHLTNMAQYNAFAQELDNAKKMYALRLGNGTSLKQTLIRQYGGQADKFYRNLINNLSGTEIYASQGVEAFSEKLLSNYKAAAVAKNISVVLKQPMSIFRALSEFSSAGIKAWNSFKDLSPSQVKAEMNEMLEHSGVAKLKNWGASENMTRKSFEELYNNEPKNFLVKINDAMDSGAEFADMWTWSRLWRMSKAEIDAQNKYTKGSKEYFEAANSKFSEVIGKTQVVQSALDSSMAVQNAGTASKFLYAFQNEPLKQYSYLTSAINDAVRGKPGAKKKLVKVIASSVANTVAVSAITTLVSLWRGTLDRDDDDELWDDILKSFSENALKDILSGGLAPVWQLAETVWTAIESGAFGKTVERMDLAALTDLGGLINKYLISQNGGRPNLGMLQDIVNAASNLFGWSAKNVIRDLKAGLDRIIFDSGLVSPMTQYNYLKAWKDVELTNKAAVTEAYYDVLRDAVDRGRYSDYVKIKRDMIYHGYTETKIKNAVMTSSLMDDLYELKKVNPGSYKAKVNSIVSSVSVVSSLEGKEFEDFIESAMKRREREDGGSKTDDEVYDDMYNKMEKEVKEQLIYIDVSKRAAYIKKMLKTYGEYGITEADILKVLRKAGKA